MASVRRVHSGCWLRGYNPYCHGSVKMLDGRTLAAHRLSWLVHRGPIPELRVLAHKCGIACCVNPEHLYVGTHSDNTRDQHRHRDLGVHRSWQDILSFLDSPPPRWLLEDVR